MKLGIFSLYTPVVPGINDESSEEEKSYADKIANLLELGVTFARSEDGRDWYESQRLFAADTLKIMFDADGIIRSAETDVSRLWPLNCYVAEVAVESVPEGFAIDGKWIYSNGEICPRVYSGAELVARAESVRADLISTARSTISEWQTELALGTISDADKSQLIAWLDYIRAVKAVDVSALTNETDYKSLAWPDAPHS